MRRLERLLRGVHSVAPTKSPTTPICMCRARVILRRFMPASYEQVPYPGFPFEQTHPDRLATMATLFGVDAASVECCRVLELGCGGGRNLIPMAFGLPKSKFTGIDNDATAIGRGQEEIAALGL